MVKVKIFGLLPINPYNANTKLKKAPQTFNVPLLLCIITIGSIIGFESVKTRFLLWL